MNATRVLYLGLLTFLVVSLTYLIALGLLHR
ncbi:MAG: hypothetical protein K0R87_2286 [Pseudonocardia sp.]|jgi:hypothetical protein|nr:hypothetical protein [Pseudonocardia sp.]